MKDKTLLIMAAGMGSRFGGLKQIEPVGPNKEVILEYSIYDALKYGFNKVVFIIKEENYEIFRSVIGKKIEDIVKVEYVFQKNDNLNFIDLPEDRIKPYGTAHAIWCAKDVINEKFGVINADDFYGEEAYKELANFLDNSDEFCVVSYKVNNTMTDNGEVKRGILKVENDYIKDIVESNIKLEDGKYYAKKLDSDEEYREIGKDTLVSMNMLGFNPMLFDYLDNDIKDFFEKNKDNLEKVEYLIPSVMDDMIKKDIVKAKSVETNATWLGMTYKEDLDMVKTEIKKKHENGEYPSKLF